MTHRFSRKWCINMSLETSLLHFGNTSLLHHGIMVSHKLRHLLNALTICLLIGCLVCHGHINEVRLLLSWFKGWCCSPILIGLIVSSRSNEAWVICFGIKGSLPGIAFRDYLKWLVLISVCWCEVSGYIIRNLQSKSFSINIEDFRLCIRIELTIFLNVLGPHLLRIFVL